MGGEVQSQQRAKHLKAGGEEGLEGGQQEVR